MRKYIVFFLFLSCGVAVFAQQAPASQTSNSQPDNANSPKKFALVIGNGAYAGLTQLANPTNDAEDIAAALEGLGFSVDKIVNGTLEQMEQGVSQLKDSLSAEPDSYGFFFYAGHGVQSYGDNYLIPVDANIPGENYLRLRAVSVQLILDELSDARNSLNVVVLDACRDNPFGWSRSETRGLTIISRQPADSIIVYATSAGQRASDGEGRNGLFTSQLLPNLTTPGLEVKEIFNRTGADVAAVSNKEQVPAIYSQFFGQAYFDKPPAGADAGSVYVPGAARPQPLPSPEPVRTTEGAPARDEAKLWTVGASMGSAFSAPWVIGTVHGTIAPLSHTFLEIGLDAGFMSGDTSVGYYSFYPFAHCAYFMPFTLPFSRQGLSCGWYIGAGGGYMMAHYNFPEGKVSLSTYAVSFISGFNIGDMFDISYTLRTDFTTTGGKLMVGYVYRFK